MNTPSPSIAEPTRPPVRGRREADRIARRERLLDAAERRFAAAGYEGTALRDVTSAAGTRLASVTDEFGGKEQLFRAVLLRRALPLETDRLHMLNAIPDTLRGGDRVSAIVDSFVQPMLTRVQAQDGWAYYFQFISQLANSRQLANLLVADDYNRIANPFVDAFMSAFPDCSDENAYDAYIFMLSSALEVFADNLRLDSLSRGKYASGDLSRRCAALRTFIAAGIVALLTESPSQQAPEAARLVSTVSRTHPTACTNSRPGAVNVEEAEATDSVVVDRSGRGPARRADLTAPDAGQARLAIAESLQDLAPDVARGIIEFGYGDIDERPGLTNPQRALIALASLVTMGTEAQIELHVNSALAGGIEPAVVVELMTQLVPYIGFPRVLDGLAIVKHSLAQRNIST